MVDKRQEAQEIPFCASFLITFNQENKSDYHQNMFPLAEPSHNVAPLKLTKIVRVPIVRIRFA